MTSIDLTRPKTHEPIPTAMTVAPTCPGHAIAQAWYASLGDRLEMEKDRQGVSALVSSNIGPIFDGLAETVQRDFVVAVGALVVTFLVDGEPNAGRWDPRDSIEDAVTSEDEEVTA